MSHVAIRAEGLGKCFRIGRKKEGYFTLRDTIMNAIRRPLRLLQKGSNDGQSARGTFWALRNVSFELDHGEVLGIIGRNGAGKSTLLKILSRIVRPTTGSADIFGRVGSLLEVGTGFHPELTGRENIYLNGAVLGMTRSEIRRKFEEIVEFSGVQHFLETPVKHYSSGMAVRLAFSIAAHLEPEILLVDEVLAVGDIEFQRKCLGKMGEVSKDGRTVLFVSHNLAALTAICRTGIVLSEGVVVFSGLMEDAVKYYLQGLKVEKGRVEYSQSDGSSLQFKSIGLLDESGKPGEVFSLSSAIRVIVEYEISEPLTGAQILCHLWTPSGTHVLATGDVDFAPNLLGTRVPGRYRAEIVIPANLLAPGQYMLQLACGIPNAELIAVRDGPIFEVIAARSYAEQWSQARRDVVVSVPLEWRLFSEN